MEQARYKQGNKADDIKNRAREKYKAAMKLNPNETSIYYSWIDALIGPQTAQKGLEEELYNEINEIFALAVKYNPNDFKLYTYWLYILMDLPIEEDKILGGRYDDLYEIFETALKIKPDSYETYNIYANMLLFPVMLLQSQGKKVVETDDIFKKVYGKYETAIKIYPDEFFAYMFYADALKFQAEIKEGIEADELFNKAYEKYDAALKIITTGKGRNSITGEKRYSKTDYYFDYQKLLWLPNDYDVYYSYAKALAAHAKTKKGTEADELNRLADEKRALGDKLKYKSPEE